jgi:hypothetical protein
VIGMIQYGLGVDFTGHLGLRGSCSRGADDGRKGPVEGEHR